MIKQTLLSGICAILLLTGCSEKKDEKVDKITSDLKSIMETSYTLEVPLRVSVCIGNSWNELK